MNLIELCEAPKTVLANGAAKKASFFFPFKSPIAPGPLANKGECGVSHEPVGVHPRGSVTIKALIVHKPEPGV